MNVSHRRVSAGRTLLVVVAGLASLATPAPRTTWRVDRALDLPRDPAGAYMLEVEWTGSGTLEGGSDHTRHEPSSILCRGERTATLLTGLGASPAATLAGTCPPQTGCFAGNCTVPKGTSLRIIKALPVSRWLTKTEVADVPVLTQSITSLSLEVESVTTPTIELLSQGGVQPVVFVENPERGNLTRATTVLTSACTSQDAACRYDRARRYACIIHMRWLGAADAGGAHARMQLVDRAPCDKGTECVPPTPGTPRVVRMDRIDTAPHGPPTR